ncbi:MAG: hypothetical protein EA361_17730 [Bacteroidetes bacterium]|nr:MAG: hypothetical protein EA361_17730 [Bacteroidota bacterium]
MKSYIKITVFLLAGLFMVSCNQNQLEQQEQEITQLTEDNEKLRQQAEEQTSSLNEFFETMAQIRENLNEIKVRQNLISEGTRDKDNIGDDMRAQIETDLEAISNLMEDNRKRLASLNRQVKDSNVKIEEFENIVANLSVEIEQRNMELGVLRDNMNQLNISNEALASAIEQLEEDRTEKQQVIEEKTELLNTAYYVVGTRQELREQEIIDRKGGLLGLGRTTVVKSDLKKDHFSKLDISQIEQVYVAGKNPSLLSLHPENSYVVETNEEGASMIFIENPAEFWSTTRYLIVSIE